MKYDGDGRKQRTKKEIQARHTRRKIIIAATTLFARQGYYKTTITDICRQAGITSGALFYHFTTKEALLEEVIRRLERGVHIYSDYLDRVESGSLQVVNQIVTIMCDHFKKQPEATICLAALATEFAGSNHPVEDRLKEVYNGFVDAFSRVLRNHPKVRDPRTAAIAFVGMVQGIAVQGLLQEKEHSIDQLANGLLDLMAIW